MRTAEDVTSLCRSELQRLGWVSKKQGTSKTTVRLKLATLEDQDQLELSERELSHPERVAEFKGFIARYNALSQRSVIVAIDELDKMSQAVDVLDFVNGIKDLLHNPGTHFLVSVSEDALAKFALRGAPLRDAFDSSFDTIVAIDRFRVNESQDLLDRRVLNFPTILTLFCHALGGGLPRDVIRAARSCIEIRQNTGAPVQAAYVVHDVATSHAVAVLGAAVAQNEPDNPDMLKVLLDARNLLQTPKRKDDRGKDLRQVAENIAGAAGTSPRFDGICATLYILATLIEYFGSMRSRSEWAQEVESDRPWQFSEAIAEAQALVAVLPSGVDRRVRAAYERVTSARRSLYPLRMRDESDEVLPA